MPWCVYSFYYSFVPTRTKLPTISLYPAGPPLRAQEWQSGPGLSDSSAIWSLRLRSHLLFRFFRGRGTTVQVQVTVVYLPQCRLEGANRMYRFSVTPIGGGVDSGLFPRSLGSLQVDIRPMLCFANTSMLWPSEDHRSQRPSTGWGWAGPRERE